MPTDARMSTTPIAVVWVFAVPCQALICYGRRAGERQRGSALAPRHSDAEPAVRRTQSYRTRSRFIVEFSLRGAR